ncbi:MAG: choice-of-anchor L domain-containing protein [Limisphaerales bacterium]
MTVLLTAQTNISANVAYHIKIAVADYGDDWYDSAVFITAAQMPCN